MEIAIIADDSKKELMTELCIAYCGILSKHSICATSITGKFISEATGLEIERMMPGSQGGAEQIALRVAYNEIDLLLFFRDPATKISMSETDNDLLRMCDLYNIPVATNIATAEILVRALERGDLDWREIVNPKSRKRRQASN
ncbi:MAG: methylglyoxal synthase [Eubacteriales bacterium]